MNYTGFGIAHFIRNWLVFSLFFLIFFGVAFYFFDSNVSGFDWIVVREEADVALGVTQGGYRVMADRVVRVEVVHVDVKDNGSVKRDFQLATDARDFLRVPFAPPFSGNRVLRGPRSTVSRGIDTLSGWHTFLPSCR